MTLDAGWDEHEAARRVADAYRARFGAEPDGVWSAPGRVNLIGEHTDYNGGLCLPLALRHRTYVALGAAADGVVELASSASPEPWRAPRGDACPGAVAGWAAYPAGVLWALGEHHDVLPGGFRAVFDSCVPLGSGLSSSAAIQCSTAVALDEVAALGLGASDGGRAELVEACVRGENEVAGARTGGMDQSASLLAREGHALLLDMRDGSHRHVPFALDEHGLTLLVIDTRVAHTHAGGEYASRRAECEAAAVQLGVATLREVGCDGLDAALERLAGGVALADGGSSAGDVVRRRVRHVVTEIARVEAFVEALERGDLDAAGALMVASHASLRDDYEVSCRELDVAVSAALDAGALGARMTGGGFGGCAIALVRADRVDAVAGAVEGAYAAEGFAPPRFLEARPSGAARRSEAATAAD
ncbi:galactokinase [Cellulomonas alba]|uniref:Galactokinase n=1 Tax=Cellulomonas alba TaxID=3053467 RepID=A0ABT7SGA5_9CELL|nr:galactokinase [Cellulomonas alba]MDM7855215.1 galactokinase [Cellulomonas alba]